MSKFDAVIGYRAIKQELLEICDMIKNPDVYRKLGVGGKKNGIREGYQATQVFACGEDTRTLRLVSELHDL